MARVIPGVQVTVVKEVVPQQLAPSGVLGIVGLTEVALTEVERASSWSRFIELCGPGSAHSMPEARQALDNGVFELVISSIKADKAVAATTAVSGDLSAPLCDCTARAPGVWANRLRIRTRMRRTATARSFDLTILDADGELESHRQLSAVPGTAQYYADWLAASSSVLKATSRVRAIAQTTRVLAGGGTAPERAALIDNGIDAAGKTPIVSIATVDKGGPDVEVTAAVTSGTATSTMTLTLRWRRQAAGVWKAVAIPTPFQLPGDESILVRTLEAASVDPDDGTRLFQVVVAQGDDAIAWPVDGDRPLAGGTDAKPVDYAAAIDRLQEEPDVDMVLAAVGDYTKAVDVTAIHASVIAHCETMSADSKGRVGFGQVAPDATAKQAVDLAQSLVSDRFVLCAPHGVVGGVAGRVGSLPYHHSPTFKAVAGLGKLRTRLRIEEQSALLRGFVVPVAVEPGKGNAVLRGLTTNGDQINVRRVADHAVRGVRMIGDLFIGSLNTEDGRSALKQKLSEFLLQMQREGAIVPSTDKVPDPAFKLDVYTSPQDFALGIVRIDLAVRPVRAIDFIYATVLIES